MGDKRSLFGMDTDDLADALESIYKQQKEIKSEIEEIKTALLALKTTVHTAPVDAGEGEDDGVPPLVKWALSQPWGVQLMHTVTDQDMISGLVKSGIEWLKNKAIEKTAEKAAEKAAGG